MTSTELPGLPYNPFDAVTLHLDFPSAFGIHEALLPKHAVPVDLLVAEANSKITLVMGVEKVYLNEKPVVYKIAKMARPSKIHGMKLFKEVGEGSYKVFVYVQA